MRYIFTDMWQRAKVTRVMALGAVIMIAAFFLFLFLGSLGDSDLPPYDPPFPGERFGWGVLFILVWPLTVATKIVGHDPPFILWFPLMFVGGIFWAAVIEAIIVCKYGRGA